MHIIDERKPDVGCKTEITRVSLSPHPRHRRAPSALLQAYTWAYAVAFRRHEDHAGAFERALHRCDVRG
jgi:hypothetical protein